MACEVENRQQRVRIDRSRLARAAGRALGAVGRAGGRVEILVVDDAAMRDLNGRWRGVRRPTDVLAFPLETPGTPGALVGQVVLSAQTAARQARRTGVALGDELDLLVTHGILHLVGWDDRDPAGAALMHERERTILSSGRRRPPARLWTGLLHP